MEKLLLLCAVIWFTELVVSAMLEILRFNRKIERFRIQPTPKVKILPGS